MSRLERWSFNMLSILVAGSGVAYLWMKYFLESTDPFAVVNHPLQPLMLQLHILTSPLLILVLGIVFQSHIARKITTRYKPNRRSGLTALVTFGTLTASGYLLQVLAHPGLSRVMLIAHLASGGVFVVSYSVHLVISVRLLRGYALRSRSPTAAAAQRG